MKTKMTWTSTCPQCFLYQTTYKVGINHTTFQFVYGLHPLLPMEYLLPPRLGEKINPTPI